MKVLSIDYDRYMYPNGIDTIEEFIEFINDHDCKFIPMTKFIEENCVHPYLVLEDVLEVYLNISNCNEISEEEITLLPREEYDRRLAECIKKVCPGCDDYTEGCGAENLTGHRDKLCLDGTCEFYFHEEDE